MTTPRYKKISWAEKTTLKSVELWTSKEQPKVVDIELENGIVKSIVPSSAKSTRILIPSGVDTQVHLRVPGQKEKETAESGILAALHGGVGALLTMPNTKPFLDSVAALQLGQEEIAKPSAEYGVQVLFSACVSKGQQGTELAPLEELYRAGAVAFTDDGKGVLEDKVMDQAFAVLEKLGAPLLQHAEMLGAEGPLAPGPLQEKLGLKPYEARLETEMVERDLHILKKYPKARYHLLHVSSKDSIPLMMKARQEGLRVTSEVTPHHLYFSSHEITAENKSFKMNPPLRGPEDRSALQNALVEGRVDWMATDHAPHESDTKTKEFSQASFGTVGLETSLQTMLWMNQKHQMSPQRFVETWSLLPARFLGIEKEFGEIEVGKALRAVLVDLNSDMPVVGENFWGLSKNTCFEGVKLPGRVLAHATRAGWFEF